MEYYIEINKTNAQELYGIFKRHNYRKRALDVISQIVEKPKKDIDYRYILIYPSLKDISSYNHFVGSDVQLAAVSDIEKHIVDYEISELNRIIDLRKRDREKYLQKAEQETNEIVKHREEIIKIKMKYKDLFIKPS